MGDLDSLFNCTVHKHLKTEILVNATALNLELSREELESAAGFNTITGIILVLFIHVVINNEHKNLRDLYRTRNYNHKLLTRAVMIILLVFVSPIIVLSLMLALVYKLICFIILKLEDKNFVKFLDSFDVFWSLEDDVTKCVITALGIIESENPQEVVESIKEKLRKIAENNIGNKIFYRRMEKYGFYYWRKPDTIDIKEYIQLIDITNSDHLDEKQLEQMLTNVSDRSLPFNEEGMFKILVTKQKIYGTGKSRHALIFKVHHSIGDGVTLMQLLCQALGDEMDSNDISFMKLPASQRHSGDKSASDLIEMIKKLFDVFVCIANKILKEPDKNSIHGPKLVGENIFKWIDEDESIYLMVKAIKDRVDGVNFSDVILAAMSQSLQNYFVKTMDRIPEHVAVIIPVRQVKPCTELKLESNFSINLLDLPINANLENISKCKRLLCQSADSLTNGGFIKLCSVLPKGILEPLMDSRHASIVFSNLPGPTEISICGGNVLKSLVFFPPSRGTTGLVITSLYYGGVLRLAARADSALISEPSDLGFILDGMVDEIKRLHTQYAK